MNTHKAAILLILLAAILMFCIVEGLGETPRRYEKRVERHILSAHQRSMELDRAPHDHDAANAYYELRVTIDIELCRAGLRHYRKGLIQRTELDRLLNQLDRDMEDFPPQVAKR